MTWEKVKMKDLYAVDSRNGLSKPSKVRGIGYKMINMGELFANGRIYDIPMELVPLSEKEKIDAQIAPLDLLFARQSLILSGAGQCSIVMETSALTVFESHIIRVRLSKELAEPPFYYYYFKSPVSPIKSIVQQGVQAGIKASDLANLEVAYPPLETQRRIAGILSAYDDLIENHRAQLRLLEEAAARLYREWFVKLRFPGHETARFTDGVPEGWRKISVEECLSYYTNGGWGKERFTAKEQNPAMVIRGTDILDIKAGDFKGVPRRFHSQNDVQKKELQENDIVFELSNGNINNIGRTLFVDKGILAHCNSSVICASFCKLLRPKSFVLAILLQLEIEHMQTCGAMLPMKKHGANGINNFDFAAFLQHTFLMPPEEVLLGAFGKIIKLREINRESVTLLKEARDRLLPRLMRGEE